MNLLLPSIFTVVFFCFANAGRPKHSSSYEYERLEMLKPTFPKLLANRRFKDERGDDWVFSDNFSPEFGVKMWIGLEFYGNFFVEYYINDFSAYVDNIIYSCKKLERVDDDRVFVWEYNRVAKRFDDPLPDICDLCEGDLRRLILLTDCNSHLPINSIPVPPISKPFKPEFCPNTYYNTYYNEYYSH